IQFGCRANGPMNVDVLGKAVEFGPVGIKGVLVDASRMRQRLLANRPLPVARQIADIAELAPAVAGRILTPAKNVELPPRTISRTGIGDHHAIAAIGQNGDLRQQTGMRRRRGLRCYGRLASLIQKSHPFTSCLCPRNPLPLKSMATFLTN